MKLLLFGMALIGFGAIMIWQFSPVEIGFLLSVAGIIVSAIGTFKPDKK